jgi:hypothetical protein
MERRLSGLRSTFDRSPLGFKLRLGFLDQRSQFIDNASLVSDRVLQAIVVTPLERTQADLVRVIELFFQGAPGLLALRHDLSFPAIILRGGGRINKILIGEDLTVTRANPRGQSRLVRCNSGRPVRRQNSDIQERVDRHMQARRILRVSSVVLFLFALGHTVGFLSFRPQSPEALDVLQAMQRVPFDFGGRTVHWMDLYTGFGLALSVTGFVSAAVAWRLGSVTPGEAALARTLAWLLCATQAANIVISLRYFGLVQAGFSAACAALLGWRAFLRST